MLFAYLLDHIDLVLLFPLPAIAVSLLIKWAKIGSWTLRECILVSISLSLALGYACAAIWIFPPVIILAMIAPQAIVLAGIGLRFLASRISKTKAYNPSLRLVIAIAVKGNGTSTTSPNSKGIVGVVIRVVPDFGEGRRTHGCGGTRERAVLCSHRDEIHEVLDFVDALLWQCLNGSLSFCLMIAYHLSFMAPAHANS